MRSRESVSRLRVHSFSISIDGYGAGPSQDLEHPLGVGGPELFDWFFHTRTWQRMHGQRGRRDRRRRRHRRAGLRRHRRVDPRPQHVRPGPRPLAG